jgi:hypothetical protein
MSATSARNREWSILYRILVPLVVAAGIQGGFAQQKPSVRSSPGTSAIAPSLDLPAILNRMSAATETYKARARAYTAVRQYRLYENKSSKLNSEVMATVSFLPPGAKSFTIDKVEGSQRGEDIVRKVLDREAELARDASSSAINLDNYYFSFRGRVDLDGHSCYLLDITPKRSDRDLLKGSAWVDADSFLVRRLDGDMAKTPSWWLKKVHLTVAFADVHGLWLQTASQASAEVRMFGQHTLTAQATDVRVADDVAQLPRPRQSDVPPARPASAPSRRSAGKRVPPMLGAGALAR